MQSVFESGIEIVLSDEGEWGIGFDPMHASCHLGAEALFAARQREGDAYDWEQLFQNALYEVSPDAYRDVVWDSEQGTFFASASSPDPLRELARIIARLVTDRTALVRAISELRPRPSCGVDRSLSVFRDMMEQEVRAGRLAPENLDDDAEAVELVWHPSHRPSVDD